MAILCIFCQLWIWHFLTRNKGYDLHSWVVFNFVIPYELCVTFSLQMEGIPSKARNLPMNLLLGRLYRISRHSRAAVAIYKECLRFVNISYTNWTFDMTSIGYLWMPLWIYFISFNLFVATALYIDLQPSGIMSTIILMSELIAFALFKHTFVMSVHPVTYLFLLS